MFGRLTKLKILILVAFIVAILIKNKEIIRYFTPYDESKPDPHTKVVVKKDDVIKKDSIKTLDSPNGKISIMITNLGLQKDNLELAKLTRQEISFGISSYAENIRSIAEDALHQNRSVAVLLPTQSVNASKKDPGPSAITLSNSTSDNARRVESILSKISIIKGAGIYLQADSVFTVNKEAVINLITILEDNLSKFKFVAYHDISGGNFLTKMITIPSMQNKFITINKVIDSSLNEQDIILSLDELAEISLKNNIVAVGSISPTKLSIETVSKWIKENEKRVEIVPLSDLIVEQAN